MNEYGTESYQYNKLLFEPVRTTSLKLVAERHDRCATGILEWVVDAF